MLGSFILLAAFVLSSGAFAASLAGARRRNTPLIDGGIGLFHTVTALMLVGSAVMIHAFVTGDYSIKYVQHYSNTAQPLFYKLASYWGGLDGSVMFWVTLLATFGSVAVLVNRHRYRELIPWVIATLATVEMFFLFLMVIHNNPFQTFLTTHPTDGQGLNPLLQNYWMAIHPPLLYLGFTGMAIPFAFGIAALASGQLDDAWLKAVRRWTMISWLFLTVGLTLGARWAYEELGWGGYWGWDPVENAGLLPWFTATAFLHSVMVQERRGMLKIWNVSLVIVTFFLTIFGTFMTRSGVVQSVHAFGEDRELALLFTLFMILTLVVSFGLVIYRMPLLRSRNELDSWVSREAAFLANNWVLLFAAFFTLFATMFPTLSEAVTGERLTVAAPFFNKWLTPVGFTLLFLTGVGPLLAWRKSSVDSLRHQFLWPVVVAGSTVAATMLLGRVLAVGSGGGGEALGIPFWPSGLCFALCAFVLTSMAQEVIRGASVRQRATGTDVFTAVVGLFARSRRRYGGYIVHVGIVLAFVGFAGNGFERNETVLLKPGQQFDGLEPYLVKYNALTVTQDPQKQMVTADLEILRGGKPFARMYPARWFFTGRESEPTTEVALKGNLGEDLYIVLAGYNAGEQSASFAIHVNPLVNWIWLGVAIMFIGTITAFLPERAVAFATSRVPEGVTTGTLLVFLMVSGGAVGLRAQHIESGQSVGAIPRSPLERDLESNIVCMCGTCGRQRIGECTCTVAAEMREQVSKLVASGKDREAIVQYFVTKYGSQEVLGAPIDTGFNRLAWGVPYATGIVGIVLVGGVALRWSRRRASSPKLTGHTDVGRTDLEDRLDDELRELD
ncbi:MAG: cytochrome c-type biogenesis CcmF C-terminal domain-containing protein [Vicinamibacterales bacterium]